MQSDERETLVKNIAGMLRYVSLDDVDEIVVTVKAILLAFKRDGERIMKFDMA